MAGRNVEYVDFSLVAASYNATVDDLSRAATGVPVVLHFIDDQCPCNRFSSPHIERLKNSLAADAIHLLYAKLGAVVLNETTITDAAQKLAALVPASPAVAIWDAKGALRYFGPYSNGAVCGEGNDMVVYTLNAIKKNSNIRWLSQEYVGCVCPWQSSET